MSNGRPLQRLPRLLICEGPEDKYFFQRLIQAHELPHFYILDAKGNGQFAEALRSFRVERTADFNSLSNILIVADNDEQPAARFQNVCSQIDRVFGADTAPNAPLQPTSSTATRSAAITILMIPWTGEHGSLERMCVEAARAADRAIAGHVDTFMDLIGADRWNNETRVGKAWLRTILAARCERDPFVALGHVFNDQQYQPLIPLNHPSFDRIINVLRRF